MASLPVALTELIYDPPEFNHVWYIRHLPSLFIAIFIYNQANFYAPFVTFRAELVEQELL